MTVFKGLYKAVFDYDPAPENANEELSIKENDILYLINDEIEDGDEGWWLFKKRLVGVDVEEPIGLVPNNYIELLTEPLYKCKALYDYEDLQNEEEEIAFKENDTFEVFDDSDGDWLLVKTVRDNIEDDEYGFIPSNYVEKIDDTVSSMPAPVDVSSFAPPPVRFDREQIANSQSPAPQSSVDLFQPPPKHKSLSEEKELPKLPNINDSYQQSNDDEPEDEAPPPKPIRPTTTGNAYKAPSQDEYRSRSEEQPNEDFESWNVQEIVDRSKKIRAKLTIGNTLLTFYSENSPGGRPEEWSLNKLVSFDLEKKHLFLELVSPSISLELHTGNSAVGRAIYDRLCEVKGASSKSLSQIKSASTVSPQRKQELREKKTAKVVVDFVAESSDELTITPGEKVYVINDTNSRDWTLVEKVDQPGKRGLVPSQFIQAVNQLTSIADSDEYNVRSKKTNTRSYSADEDDYEIEPEKKESKTKKLLRSLTGKKSETSSKFSSNTKLKPQTTGSWKDDASQNTRSSRSASVSSKINGSQSNRSNKSPQKTKERSHPNSKKVRSWVDRSATFKVDAELIGASQGKIHLHKTNGVKIAVPAEKLSLQDLEYVEKSTGFSLDKYKPQTRTVQEPLQAQPTDARDKERERRIRLKEREDREHREREVEELRKARELLEQERKKLREEKERDFARLKELQMSGSPAPSPAPVKPPRPQQTGNTAKPLKNDMTGRNPNLPYYDWFEFFLKTGVDVNNCQRYTINFEREDITEDILPSIDATLLRSLGLKEGDILRVMKYLDDKFGRNQPLAPKSPEPAIEDTNWAAKPTMHTKKSVDSIQDLLDLKPAATGSQPAITPKPVAAADTSAPAAAAPLDPFKTGGGNILPMGIIPMITGGMMLQPSFTGIQPIGRMVTGGMILPVQKTGMGLVPATTFGQSSFAGSAPQLSQTTGGAMPNLTFGQPQVSMPQNTFGQQMTGGVMPMPQNTFGQQMTGGAMSMPQSTFGQQMTGGAMPMPQNTFGQQMTGGAMSMPQNTFGQQMTGGFQPQSSFGQQMTGGYQPQNTFNQQMTGGFQPQSSFGQQMTGGAMPMPQNTFGQQYTGGFQPQSSFGMTLQRTGGVAPLPQTSFGQPQQMPNLAQQNNIYNNQNSQMLQQQPTGFGFGNAPQQTGGAANLNNASVNNPFGF